MIQSSIASIIDKSFKNDWDWINEFLENGLFDVVLNNLDSQDIKFKIQWLNLILKVWIVGSASLLPKNLINIVVEILETEKSNTVLKTTLLIITSYLENDFNRLGENLFKVTLDNENFNNERSIDMRIDTVKSFAELFIEAGGIEALKSLSYNENREISNYSNKTINTYFRKWYNEND